MQKTRFGISVGMLAAAIYFTGLFSGYLVAVLMVGYVLLFEENEWLKKSAVKMLALMIFFSFFTTLLNLVPNAIEIINNIFSTFGGYFTSNLLKGIVAAIVGILNFIEKILFIMLGVKAFSQGTIAVPFIDRIIEKYMTR